MKITISENGSTTLFTTSGVDCPISVVAEGTFGSGTLKIEWQKNKTGTWQSIGTDLELTAPAVRAIEHLPPGIALRATLSGATNPDIELEVSGPHP